MKFTIQRLLNILGMSLATMAIAQPITESSTAEHVFVPKGFDDNDNVELFVSGTFPNTCYSRNKVESKVTDRQIDITITSLVNRAPGAQCQALEVPYVENVTLGTLEAGTYTIFVNKIQLDSITVDETSSTHVDDFLYAQVDYVELGFSGGLDGSAFLVGRKPNCIEFDHMEYISNSKDTLAIQPIMKLNGQPCTHGRKYYSIPIKFDPKTFTHSQVLLFVRTMDGKSVSTIVDLNP